MIHWKEKKLSEMAKGESFITSEKGNSMTPIFQSNEDMLLTKIDSLDEVEVGDAVFCKVKGSYFTHLVKAKDEKKGCLIGNNHGKINGWTKNVFAIATKIKK